MIDLRAARAEPERWRAALARKGAAEVFDELLEADRRWRELQPQVDELRSRTKQKGKPSPEELEQLRADKEALQRLEAELAAARGRVDELHLQVPNPPADDTPDGDSDEDAAELRRVGEPPAFAFEPRDHLDLAAAHGWLDVERGGSFSLRPDVPCSASRRYIGDTNVLETTYTTDRGAVRVVDAMTLPDGRLDPMRELVRSVEGLSGAVPMAWVAQEQQGSYRRKAISTRLRMPSLITPLWISPLAALAMDMPMAALLLVVPTSRLTLVRIPRSSQT